MTDFCRNCGSPHDKITCKCPICRDLQPDPVIKKKKFKKEYVIIAVLVVILGGAAGVLSQTGFFSSGDVNVYDDGAVIPDSSASVKSTEKKTATTKKAVTTTAKAKTSKTSSENAQLMPGKADGYIAPATTKKASTTKATTTKAQSSSGNSSAGSSSAKTQPSTQPSTTKAQTAKRQDSSSTSTSQSASESVAMFKNDLKTIKNCEADNFHVEVDNYEGSVSFYYCDRYAMFPIIDYALARNVDELSDWENLTEEYQTYYAFYDINKDGTNELLVGVKDPGAKKPQVRSVFCCDEDGDVWNIYEFQFFSMEYDEYEKISDYLNEDDYYEYFRNDMNYDFVISDSGYVLVKKSFDEFTQYYIFAIDEYGYLEFEALYQIGSGLEYFYENFAEFDDIFKYSNTASLEKGLARYGFDSPVNTDKLTWTRIEDCPVK